MDFAGHTFYSNDDVYLIGFERTFDKATNYDWQVFVRLYGAPRYIEAHPSEKAAKDRLREMLAFFSSNG